MKTIVACFIALALALPGIAFAEEPVRNIGDLMKPVPKEHQTQSDAPKQKDSEIFIDLKGPYLSDVLIVTKKSNSDLLVWRHGTML